MKNSTFYVIILSAFMAFAFNSCSSTVGNSPGKAVLKLYETMKNKEFDKTAKMYVTKDGEKLSEDEAKKVEGMIGMGSKEYEEKGGLDKVTIEEEEISEDGNSAKVKYTIHFKNGETDDEKVSLFKFEGNWVFKIIN